MSPVPEGQIPGGESEREKRLPEPGPETRVPELVRQLAAIEAELARAADMGGIDSVIDPATMTPILLRQAQADLAASEVRFDRLVKAMSAVVFELTPEGELQFINDAVMQITGYTPQELFRPDYCDLLFPGELRQQVDELARRLPVGNVSGYEMILAAKDGSPVMLELNTANQYLPDGSLERVVGIATDISRRKQAEAALRASEEQLRNYSRRLVDSIENERRSLARELHDQAAQSMSALKMSLAHLRREADHERIHDARFEEIGMLVDGVLDDLHRLAINLRPISLDRYGLLRAVEQFVETYRRQSGLTVDLVAVGLEEHRLPPSVETAIYRVIQEALTNVLRHARAKRVGVLLERKKERIICIVEDDGEGFDLADAERLGRLGITGMRERAEVLGGSVTIESARCRGTTIYADVPLPAD